MHALYSPTPAKPGLHDCCCRPLTPLTLTPRHSGKSPVYVDASVRDLDMVARRIAWGKIVNAGQVRR